MGRRGWSQAWGVRGGLRRTLPGPLGKVVSGAAGSGWWRSQRNGEHSLMKFMTASAFGHLTGYFILLNEIFAGFPRVNEPGFAPREYFIYIYRISRFWLIKQLAFVPQSTTHFFHDTETIVMHIILLTTRWHSQRVFSKRFQPPTRSELTTCSVWGFD